MNFSMRKKEKKKIGTYTLHKFEDPATSCDMFKLIDDNARNIISTHNMAFMLNFICRLKESGHDVKLDVSFCDKHSYDDDCAGCVFYTQRGCMFASAEDKEGVIICQDSIV